MKNREDSLIEEIKSNSLQMEQLSEDVRGLMHAIRDLTEQIALPLELAISPPSKKEDA
jgi:hypothetical protein